MLREIPTHLIGGPLGAGKTSLIRSLLAQKPAGERWAVLVNEFGEIGLDAALLATDVDGVASSPSSSSRKRYAMRRTRPATRWSCVCNQVTTTATTSSPVSSRITCAIMPGFSTVDPRYLKPVPIRGRITP